jgi:hypothetical protein
MTEDAPPSDMEGRDENPDAPKVEGETTVTVDVPIKKKKAGYPIEEALRPIVLPKNMSEVGLGPHARLGLGSARPGFANKLESSRAYGGYVGSDALRARYGITPQVQIGLTYTYGGVFDKPNTITGIDYGFAPGKTVGLDVTYLIRDFVGVRVGVPVHIDTPGENSGKSGPAVSLAIGVPMKFTFGDKYALGALDDFLNIAINRFAPSYDQEAMNALNANEEDTMALLSRGYIRFAAYGVMQRDPKTALIGRVGVHLEDFTATASASSRLGAGATTFIRAEIKYTPRKYLDVGGSLGFDDLSDLGSFGPSAMIALRI